jgi:group I intron endonuclease
VINLIYKIKIIMIIYKVTNKINNKCYIGQTRRSLKIRKNEHLHGNRYFDKILKKNIDQFEWTILCECQNTIELNKLEKYYIKLFNSFGDNGYNKNSGGSKTYKIKKEHRKYKKICLCGKEFETSGRNEYCSKKCSYDAILLKIFSYQC